MGCGEWGRIYITAIAIKGFDKGKIWFYTVLY